LAEEGERVTKNLQRKIIADALESGFEEAEVYYQEAEGFEVLIMEGEVSNFENSQEAGISFRGRYHGKMGYAHTEKLVEESIPYLLETAKENAEILSLAEEEGIYSGDAYGLWNGYVPSLEEMGIEERIDMAKRMERAALSSTGNVAQLDYCMLGMHKVTIGITNSAGLHAVYTKNGAMGYVSAIARKNGETKTGDFFWKGQDWRTFNPEETGQTAAKRAAALLGASSVPSGVYSVILDGRAMTALLSAFSSVFFAESVQKGFSLLAGKSGERIGAGCVTIRDDGLLERGYASVPFDSEGVGAKNKVVVEDGVLKTLLYNRKTAKVDGVESTGNGFKGGLTAPIKTACTNFYITAGKQTRAQLLEQMGDGLYITGLMGLHAGVNVVSGDFSLSAEGFLVEEERLTHGVEQITIAGNFYQLLMDIRGITDDVFFAQSGKGSPDVWVKALSVAGA